MMWIGRWEQKEATTAHGAAHDSHVGKNVVLNFFGFCFSFRQSFWRPLTRVIRRRGCYFLRALAGDLWMKPAELCVIMGNATVWLHLGMPFLGNRLCDLLLFTAKLDVNEPSSHCLAICECKLDPTRCSLLLEGLSVMRSRVAFSPCLLCMQRASVLSATSNFSRKKTGRSRNNKM